MRIREFVLTDLPAVLALRRLAFAQTAQASDEAAMRYWRLVLAENPWPGHAAPAWVCEDDHGAVIGFLGQVRRPMRFRGRDIIAATPTQLMANPKGSGLIGIQLLKKFMTGDHDLAFSDAANDTARRLWEGLGGWTGHLASLQWTRPLRAVRYGMQAWGSHPLARAFRLGLAPAALVADTVSSSGFTLPAGYAFRPLTPADAIGALDAALHRVSLIPRYDEASFAWLLERVRERAAPPATHAEAVEHGGAVVGWYVWQRRGQRGEVVQLAAAAPHRLAVLQTLLHRTAAAGLTSAGGRYDPLFAEAFAAESCIMQRGGAWALVQSRDADVGRAALGGDAFLSRLEGEWWMNF